MRSTSTIVLAAALIAATAVPAHAAGLVRTDTGFVSGTTTEALRSFQGIPFAAPPVGENRWRDPQPARPWQGVLRADRPGQACDQAEDCLHLNVTAPRHASRKPVLVWIHGGSFVTGAGADYGPDRLARNGSVVVTNNYRLGAAGYFGFPGLPGSGAFGLSDQQAALEWVQRNIRQFGGDPRNVTVFGASAGGLSTCAQLTSPKTRRLFHKAIIQSGPCAFGTPAGENHVEHAWKSREDVERLGAAATACPDIACLRGLTFDEVKALQQFASPAFGTEALPENPITALEQGRFHRVPILAGTARDEFSVFAAWFYPPLDAQAYEQALTDGFGATKAQRVLAAYPPKGGDERVQLSKALSDMTSTCPTRELRRQTGAFGYEFTEPAPPMIFPDMPDFPYGAYHGSELPFLFNYANTTLTPKQQRLSDEMVEAWTRFARTGHPGWQRQDVRLLATEQVAPADHRCDLWSS
ncbi:carboxylesterase/lipase family protein [Lentzea sp. NPDC058450]|uniref:carboxylesterase/lipase family protein n=1 Tax=Lentzea sp. NPDC058450 TaxID=3346505 RepID=UPI0036565E87